MGENARWDRTYVIVEGVKRVGLIEMVGRKVVAVEVRMSVETGASGVAF